MAQTGIFIFHYRCAFFFFFVLCAPKRLFRFIFVSSLLPWVTAACPLQAERGALLLLEALRKLMTQVSLPPWASRK